jgi:uncharacterized protein YjbJ (UPF0337 family)
VLGPAAGNLSREISLIRHARFAPHFHTREIPMRSIAILAACAALTAGTVPLVVHAQTTTQTVKADTQTMWEKIKGSWSQTKGAVKEQWGKLTDDDLLTIEGRRDQLVGKIQTRYGISQDQAEAQVSAWEQKHSSDM